MAKQSKIAKQDAAANARLAEFIADRIATSVPSCTSYRAAIAECAAAAIADAIAGNAEPESEPESHALDTD